MEKLEFETQMSSIEMIKNQIAPIKQEISNTLGTTFSNNVATLINLINERDKAFAEYLQSLKDFNYDSELTTPSELFKGIRTVADEVDPGELNKKTEQMKKNALAIESKSKQIDAISTHIMNTLKRSIGGLSELMIQENQLYDMSVNLLSELDSVYDIGQIASNIK